MRRELVYIEGILANVMAAEIRGEPAELNPDFFPNEEARKAVQYFTPLLVEAGFLRQVKDQPDFTALEHFNRYFRLYPACLK